MRSILAATGTVTLSTREDQPRDMSGTERVDVRLLDLARNDVQCIARDRLANFPHFASDGPADSVVK